MNDESIMGKTSLRGTEITELTLLQNPFTAFLVRDVFVIGSSVIH